MDEDKTAEYYTLRAPTYEQIYYRDHEGRRRELADAVGKLSRLTAGCRVLELATGTGYWTEVMSRTAVSITASDISEAMLVEAGKKEFGCPVEFVAADMFNHEFESDAFDLVALGFWFSHQPRQEYDRLFDVLERPLRAGGTIWMIDNNPSAEGGIFRSLRTDAEGNHYQLRELPDGTKYEILKNYFDKADLERILSDRFLIERLQHDPYYWTAQIRPRGGN